MQDIRCRRIYDKSDTQAAYGVLIDRLWPRGIRREDARIDYWAKDLAPSTELRKKFNHQSEYWPAFLEAYKVELADRRDDLDALLEAAQGRDIVLLYAAKNEEHNNAIAFRQILQQHCNNLD